MCVDTYSRVTDTFLFELRRSDPCEATAVPTECVFVCVCVCVCVCVRMYACMCANLCVYLCVYACMYACMRVCTYACMCVCMFNMQNMMKRNQLLQDVVLYVCTYDTNPCERTVTSSI